MDKDIYGSRWYIQLFLIFMFPTVKQPLTFHGNSKRVVIHVEVDMSRIHLFEIRVDFLLWTNHHCSKSCKLVITPGMTPGDTASVTQAWPIISGQQRRVTAFKPPRSVKGFGTVSRIQVIILVFGSKHHAVVETEAIPCWLKR